MSLDRRLREELQREAARIPVDVERNLGAVEGRTRHPAPSLLPVLLGAAAVAALIVVRLASPSVTVGPSAPPSAAVESANPFATIAGIYQATLESADDPSVIGKWTMELRPNGEIVLLPPPTFSGASITPTGISYAIDGDRFRTDMFYNDFCAAVGTYTWALRGESLTLTPATEPCALREALLSTTPWTRLP